MKKKTLTLEVGLQIIFANEIISRTKKELDTEMAWFSFLQKRKRNQVTRLLLLSLSSSLALDNGEREGKKRWRRWAPDEGGGVSKNQHVVVKSTARWTLCTQTRVRSLNLTRTFSRSTSDFEKRKKT